MTPKEPTYSASFTGDYRAVGDCLYLHLSSESIAWRKVELDSVQTTRLTLGTDDVAQGHLDVSAQGDQVRIVSMLYNPIALGSDYWARKLPPIIESCRTGAAG